jgi:hypothetical protein
VIELAPEHSAALHAAIEAMDPLVATWFDKLDPDDASRSDRGEELRLISPTRRRAPKGPWWTPMSDGCCSSLTSSVCQRATWFA